jgi:hypothetical protein
MLDTCSSGQGTVTTCCENCNKPSRFLTWRDVSRLAERLLAPEKGVCSMELV